MSLFPDDAQHQYTDDELAAIIAESKPPIADPDPETSVFLESMNAARGVPPEETDAFKLNYLYETAVEVRHLIAQFTPQDVEKVQKTMANPIVKKLMGIK